MLNKKIKTMINELKGMEKTQYEYIASFLKKSNFLVFGCGFDTPMWKVANQGGKTIFLENVERWIDKTDKNVYHINYSCHITQADKLLDEYKKGQYDNLMVTLPEIITDTQWDYILVDSPMGYNNTLPGRMQSIFMAKILASQKTEIFVHDCHRPVEDEYTKTMFSKIINNIGSLRHLKK